MNQDLSLKNFKSWNWIYLLEALVFSSYIITPTHPHPFQKIKILSKQGQSNPFEACTLYHLRMERYRQTGNARRNILCKRTHSSALSKYHVRRFSVKCPPLGSTAWDILLLSVQGKSVSPDKCLEPCKTTTPLNLISNHNKWHVSQQAFPPPCRERRHDSNENNLHQKIGTNMHSHAKVKWKQHQNWKAASNHLWQPTSKISPHWERFCPRNPEKGVQPRYWKDQLSTLLKFLIHNQSTAIAFHRIIVTTRHQLLVA